MVSLCLIFSIIGSSIALPPPSSPPPATPQQRIQDEKLNSVFSWLDFLNTQHGEKLQPMAKQAPESPTTTPAPTSTTPAMQASVAPTLTSSGRSVVPVQPQSYPQPYQPSPLQYVQAPAIMPQYGSGPQYLPPPPQYPPYNSYQQQPYVYPQQTYQMAPQLYSPPTAPPSQQQYQQQPYQAPQYSPMFYPQQYQPNGYPTSMYPVMNYPVPFFSPFGFSWGQSVADEAAEHAAEGARILSNWQRSAATPLGAANPSFKPSFG